MKISKIVKEYPSGKTKQVEYRVNELLHNPNYIVLDEEDLIKVPNKYEYQVVPGAKAPHALTTYYESGQLESITDYFQNKKHGIAQWYFETGEIECESHWFNNGAHRDPDQPAFIWWFKSGEIRSRSYWVKERPVNGPLVSRLNTRPHYIEYDIQGKILKTSYIDEKGRIYL
mgnify:CR=1 FL=1